MAEFLRSHHPEFMRDFRTKFNERKSPYLVEALAAGMSVGS
jgi:hypothetical protein